MSTPADSASKGRPELRALVNAELNAGLKCTAGGAKNPHPALREEVGSTDWFCGLNMETTDEQSSPVGTWGISVQKIKMNE